MCKMPYQQRRRPQSERLQVEMAGVEPASEEKTIETTPYIVCLATLARPKPTDRILAEQPRDGPRRHVGADFVGNLRGVLPAILPEFGASSEPGRRNSWRRTA